MPRIYLSPSLQEFNQYTGGGNEELYMNLVADAMEPYLRASGIDFTRNDPGMTLSQVIAQSNAGNYDLHLAIHSNAAAGELAGQMQGADIYYSPVSVNGRRAAEIFAANYQNLYPDPEMVNIRSTTSLAEVNRTRAPAILIETAYHDNPEDAQWIRDNVENIGRNLAQSTAQFLGVPFVTPTGAPQAAAAVSAEPITIPVMTPSPSKNGPVSDERVRCGRGSLCLMEEPHPLATVLGTLPDGAKVEVLGREGGWAAIRYGGRVGYVADKYLRKEPMD
ncbi:MAG: SH3 domain-containing protein [Clostridiales bacterium]|jgi:N-acetylmuramoyl-L-alanine amidase|nr:SH3 domain-containing protein [Clostridiales bacterium]